MATIELNHLYKDYSSEVRAVTDFDMTIHDEEFIVLVGPSGCGKSTTLRMIAGLEDISSGEIIIDGKKQNDLHPRDRDIAMVFQNYALYPHMTVFDNMAFGLNMRKMDKNLIEKKVKEAAEILDIDMLLDRKPAELSGGQRQRVALGRAIVREAKVFLMDEPLSNLDAKLRFQTRNEITKLHRRLQTTTIYVTHDQTEAMSMATRIVVMNAGIIQQIGSPKEIYLKPANIFVGQFIGSPAMNFVPLVEKDDHIQAGQVNIYLPEATKHSLANSEHAKNGKLTLGVRPENIQLIHEGQDFYGVTFPVELENAELMGSETLLYFRINDELMISKVNSMDDFIPGQEIHFGISYDHLHFFDEETGLRIELSEDALVHN